MLSNAGLGTEIVVGGVVAAADSRVVVGLRREFSRSTGVRGDSLTKRSTIHAGQLKPPAVSFPDGFLNERFDLSFPSAHRQSMVGAD